MFDTKVISKRIKDARVAKNMTQMDLADAMGVSYQAVSNWERGNTLPDISKIEPLCKALGISFEELLGSEAEETTVVRKAIDDVGSLSVKEVSKIAPMVKPADLENTIKRDKSDIDLEVLVELAVFLDDDELEEMAGKITSVSDAGKLAGLAPFVSEKVLGKLALLYEGNWGSSLNALAPFMDEDALGAIAVSALEKGNIDIEQVKKLSVFLDRESIGKIMEYIKEKGELEDLLAFAPFV
ncbi:MAG: helix-turn-helix domain-containing protein [Agathobacter sp.]